MKQKLILSFVALFCNALLASALSPIPMHKKDPSLILDQNISSGAKIHFNAGCNRFDLSQNPLAQLPGKIATPAPASGANGEITEPSGEAHDYLYSYYMVDAWGESNIAGKPVKIYFDQEDNSVYLEKFLDEYMGNCYYIAGKLIEGDSRNGVLEFETRKAVYYSWGNWLMLIVADFNAQTGEFYVNDEVNTFKLYIEDGVVYNYDTYIALAAITDDTDVYWLQSNLCYDPINLDDAHTVQIPDDAVMSHYYQTVNGNDERIACIYRDGNDFYFNNIFQEGFTFKGSLVEDYKIAVDLPQLVTTDNEFVYLNTYYELDNSSYKPGEGETIYFDFDPETGDISYQNGVPLTLFSGNKFLYLSYDMPYSSLDFVKFSENEEPVVIPASAVCRLYSMSSGYDEQGNHKAGLMKIARDGNDVYFMRIDNNNYDVVMKGTLDPSTNKVSVNLSQIVGINGSTFLGLCLAKQSIVLVEDYYAGDYKEIRYVEDTDAPDVMTIDFDPDSEVYQCNDVLAVINAQKHSVSIALINPTYSPVAEVAEIPADADAHEFVFSRDGDVNNSTEVTVYNSGNDFYFVHPSPNMQIEDMTIHGVLNSDGNIEIDVPQLVAHGKKDQGIFLRVGKSRRSYTPEDSELQMRSWRVFYDEDVDKIFWNFDEGIHEFNLDGHFSLVQFSDCQELVSAENPYYKTFLLGAFEPAAPTCLELVDKSEDYWGNQQRYRLDFSIPCQSVEGKYLPYENLSFRLYFDDEPFVFTPDQYPLTFTENVIDVPFNHPASSEIPHPIWDSTMRQVYLYSLPNEKIGVQSCYSYDNESIFSSITYLDIPSSKLNQTICGNIPSSVSYFDSLGRPASPSQSGVVIVKKTYPNGNVVTEKIINSDYIR